MAPQTSEGNGMTYERALETAINMRLRTDSRRESRVGDQAHGDGPAAKEARRLELKRLHMLKTAKALTRCFDER